MIYQFIDWRIGLHRRMCVVQVDSCFRRLRETENGRLPFFLRTWEQRLIFAGESRINLPEMQVVAESITISDVYPSLKWLDDEYAKFLIHVRANDPALLVDPTPLAAVPEPKPFDKIVQGSISNVDPQEDGVKCSDLDPATSTLGTTSTALPN